MTFKPATREEWIAARKILLEKEKAHIIAGDALISERQQLPHVKLDKEYTFNSLNSSTPVTLLDLFEGRKQLVIYHFMLGPDDTEGCSGCSYLADNLPQHWQHLKSRDTSFALVSRAPVEKIAAFKKRMGWEMPWYSSFGTDFNHNFHSNNWEDKPKLDDKGKVLYDGEQPGMSVFFRGPENAIYHTYSVYDRGLDSLLVTNALLDTTPLGSQENPPPGVVVKDWLHHDKYEADAIGA